MYLLIWHLQCTKDFRRLIHCLGQNVIFRKHGPKNGQHSFEQRQKEAEVLPAKQGTKGIISNITFAVFLQTKLAGNISFSGIHTLGVATLN